MTQRQKKELQKYQNCLPYVEVKDNNIEKALSAREIWILQIIPIEIENNKYLLIYPLNNFV